MGVNNSGVNIFAGAPPMDPGTTGRVFYVGSVAVPGGVAGSDNAGSNGDSPQRPFATLDYAVGYCTASRGDVIYLLPGHAETISTATALALDVAGIKVLGLGDGLLRPTFTVGTAATATVTISAANVTVKNVVVISALDGLDTAITVTGAGCTLDIEHRDTSVTVEADIAIACSGDNFTCKLVDVGFSGGDQRDQSITLNGVDNARINIDFFGKVVTAVVNFITVACTNVDVRGYMYVGGATTGAKDVVDTIGSSTWYADVLDGSAGSRFSGGSASAFASDDTTAIITRLGTESATDPISEILSGTAGITTWKSGAAPATGVSMSEALRYALENVINGAGTTLPSGDSLYGVLAGATGITTFPTAAAAANSVSLAEVVRYISEYQVPRIVSKTIAAWGTSFTTGLSPVSLFTVTGNVKCRVFMVQTTAATSTATTGTIAIGVSGNTGGLAAAVTANGTNFPTNSVWAGDTSPTLLGEVLSGSALNWFLIGNSATIIATIATNDMTAGASIFYCEYIPLNASSTVVAA